MIDKLGYIILDRPMPLEEGVFPWAVPMLIDEDETPIAMDPLNVGEIEAYLGGYDYDIGDEIEFFKKSILYSAYAGAVILSHHSIKPLLQESFLYPALRVKPRGRNYKELRDMLEGEAESIYDGVRETVARALSLAIIRYYYYSGVREWERIAEIDEQDVSAIILAMASIGRSNLPVKPVKPDMTGYIAGFISRSARGLIRKIEREYRETVLDEEYTRILAGLRSG